MADALLVVRAGLLVTIQDLGRPGWGRYGVSPSGAMDRLAARAANALVGNQPGAALLELTGPGAEIELPSVASGPRLIALAGADLGAEIADAAGTRAMSLRRAELLRPGQRMRATQRRRGTRGYLAVAGGIVAPAPVFGSAATDLGAALGGVDGRPLRAGQWLALGDGAAVGVAPVPAAADRLDRWYADPFRLRFIAAPDAQTAALDVFAAAPYRVTPQSNRMGFRFDGPALPVPAAAVERISEPLPGGTIQIPGDGKPILLMADRQTVGGYRAIGYVIRADLAKAAQLWPGDVIRFAAVALADAETAGREQRADLAVLVGGHI